MAEEEKQDLLQLYRFCFLMLADAAKAQEIFHATLRDAAQLAANGEAPRDRLWFFRNARWRCLEVSEQGLQAEDVDLEQDELAESAPSQIEKLEPARNRGYSAQQGLFDQRPIGVDDFGAGGGEFRHQLHLGSQRGEHGHHADHHVMNQKRIGLGQIAGFLGRSDVRQKPVDQDRPQVLLGEPG